MKKLNILAAVLLMLCVMLSGCSEREAADAEIPVTYEKGTPVTDKDSVTVENENMSLQFDTKRCAFSLTEKATGNEWLSNPAADYQDPIAANITRTDLQSQIILTYKQDMANLRTTNSASSAVLKKTFTVTEVKDGIRVDYTFKEGFTVPVMYTLNPDGFTAKVLCGEVTETGTSTIYSIQLLPFFGAAGEADGGYMFVPDGSGAIIDFNNGKTSVPEYSKIVYGADDSLPNYYERSRQEEIRLPVFGMKKNGGAFLAVIEDGDGFAYVNASVSGVKTALNNIYATGVYRATERLTILNGSLGTAGNSLYTALEPANPDSFGVKYIFLKPDNADYSGMAAAYRGYLTENGELKKNDEKTLMLAEFFGGVSKKMSFMGFGYDGLCRLTSFGEAKDIIAELKGNGIDDITVSYRGMSGSGYGGKLETDLNPVGSLGGPSGWKELTDYTSENNISLFVEADFYAFFGSGNGFSSIFDVSKTLDMSASALWYKGLNTNIRDTSRGRRYLLKPRHYGEAMNNLAQSASKNNVSGITLCDISNRLSGDYAPDGFGRQRAISAVRETLSKDGLSFMLKTPNAYMLGGAAAVTDIPVASSGHLLFDRDVPFYQMVLRGSAPYSGYALNINNNSGDMFLKHVESLTGLKYAYMAAKSDELKSTELVNFYGLGNGNKKSAAEAYRVMGKISALVGDGYAVKHETYGSTAAMTYSSGATVMVNYSADEWEFGGAKVPGRGWAVLKNGSVAASGSEVPLFD